MSIAEMLLLAIGLSMDAFAVSICKGLSLGKIKPKHCLICGAWFGIFQGIMPIFGYFLGTAFANFISRVSYWIAFGLLVAIGLNMIREAMSEDDEEVNSKLDFKTMLLLAIATSIDALAVGVTFALLDVNIFVSSGIIATVTFIVSAAGVKIGSIFGEKYRQKAVIAGGIVLILIGLKILLEGLNIIK